MKYVNLTDNLLRQVCQRLGQDRNLIHVGLEFVTPEEITSLNKEFRGKDKPTDVLSFPLLDLKGGEVITPKNFPLDTHPETGRVELGDVVICLDVAIKQASEHGHGAKREIAFLYVHGVLHLFGYAHDTREDEIRMNSMTEAILKGANIE